MPSATARTDVPAGTLRVDPSGSETVISLIARFWYRGCSRVVRLRGFRRYGGTAFAWLAQPKLTLRPVSRERRLVGAGGLEPLTSSVSGRRSNQLSYAPVLCEFRREPERSV